MLSIKLDLVEQEILQCKTLVRAPLLEPEQLPHKWIVVVMDAACSGQMDELRGRISDLYSASTAKTRAATDAQKLAIMTELEDSKDEFIESVKSFNTKAQEAFDELKASLSPEELETFTGEPKLKSVEVELAARQLRAENDCKFVSDQSMLECKRLMAMIVVLGSPVICLGTDGWSTNLMGTPIQSLLETDWTPPMAPAPSGNHDAELSNIAKMVPNGSHFVLTPGLSADCPLFAMDLSARFHRLAVGTFHDAFVSYANWTRVEPDISGTRFVARMDDSALFLSWDPHEDLSEVPLTDEIKSVLCSRNDISAQALRVWYGEDPETLEPDSIWTQHPDIYSLFLAACQVKRPDIDLVAKLGLAMTCKTILLKAMRETLTEENSPTYLKRFWDLTHSLAPHFDLAQINAMQIG